MTISPCHAGHCRCRWLYQKTAALTESGTFTTLEDGEHLLDIYEGWFMGRDGQLMALVGLQDPQLYTEETVFGMEETIILPRSLYGFDDRPIYEFNYSEECHAEWMFPWTCTLKTISVLTA